MQSKNKKAMNTDEREYVRMVKLLPCSVCDAGGGEGAPSEAHEVEQGKWWLSVALCRSCHRGEVLGLHGQRRMWAVKRMTELDALAVTIRRVFALILRGHLPARRA
jgi:hypothetical protein